MLMEFEKINTHKYKVLLLGDGAVGKTSLIRRYVDNKFSGQYATTMGMEPYYKEEKFENTVVGLSVWDVAGQERFKAMRKMFYRGTMGIILICDVTRRDTLENLVKWKDEVKDQLNLDLPIVVVTNKIDLEDRREFTPEEGKEFAEKLGNCNGYFETSALTGDQVKNMFNFLANEIMKYAEDDN
jgi:small GTP-binding protein